MIGTLVECVACGARLSESESHRDGCRYADPINPAHYQKNGVQVIDVIEAYSLGYALGNVAKYILRAGSKTRAGESKSTARIRDLKKAAWYLNREIERLSKQNPETGA